MPSGKNALVLNVMEGKINLKLIKNLKEDYLFNI